MSKYLAPSEDFSKGTAYMATFHSDHFGFKPKRVKQFTLSLRFSQAKTKGSFGATNTVKTKELNIKNIQSTIQAKNINIDSDSVKLIASTIKAKEAQITAEVMELITKKDSKFYSYFSDKSGGMTRTLHNKGSIKEALKEAKIEIDDKLIFNQKDITQKLDSKNLIKTLSSQGNYTTEQIKLIKEVVNNKEWDDKTKSLSGVGGIIVAVVVSIVTAGAGAALVGGAAASTATTATTLVTTQTIQTAVVQSLVTGVTNQVATAALTGNSFKLDTKALVRGAVSAGVASYVNPAIYNQMGINSDSMDISDLAGRTMIDTTTQTAVSGGSFKDNLVKNSVNNLGAKAFKEIGDHGVDRFKDGDYSWEDGSLNKTLFHSATGAAIAKLQGEDALTGALSAGARELASPLSKDSSEQTQQMISKIIGSVIGQAISGDEGAKMGANIAYLGEVYNRQLHQDEIKLRKTPEAKELIEAIAEEYNMKEEKVYSIFVATQKSMVNQIDKVKLDMYTNLSSNKEIANDLKFIINEAKDYFTEASHGKVYVDNNTKSLIPMMNSNNYGNSFYKPDSHSKMIKDSTKSLILTGAGLYKEAIISVPAWGIDTYTNIEKTNFNNYQDIKDNITPSFLGNPYATDNMQRTGAGISIFNLMNSLKIYNEDLEKLEKAKNKINGVNTKDTNMKKNSFFNNIKENKYNFIKVNND